ncbi:MAG: MurR/RpiR family transcriptional regulator [Rickettsiales bacterium]
MTEPQAETSTILDHMMAAYASLSPQLQKAAQYVVDNPNEVGVNSMRQLAGLAGVKPNTLIRMTKTLGFGSYEDFRAPFREVLRRGIDSYPDRVRWLQHIGHGGSHGQLYSQLAETFISNTETLYSTISADELRTAAKMLTEAKAVYVLGMGACYPLMLGFYYVARMAFDTLSLVPQQASLPIDDLSRIGAGDVLLAATYRPYRRETVEATRFAKERGARLISVTDSRTSPVAAEADILLVTPTSTPQFFPSTLSMNALLESLLAFMVAESVDASIAQIERFHRKRRDLSVYWNGDLEE